MNTIMAFPLRDDALPFWRLLVQIIQGSSGCMKLPGAAVCDHGRPLQAER